jgi:predicted O-linked N-acetylglucosamine transferase (SPINDLY family)
MEAKIRAIFADRGVAADRLEIVGRIPIDVYFSHYREIDVALDSLPYNGATTTCDALLMGVPVATVAGDRSIARGGVSLLSAVGLTEWIAASRDDFVEMVRTRTQDPEKMANLRATLPATMRASALMDGWRFARDLETVFQAAWNERASV